MKECHFQRFNNKKAFLWHLESWFGVERQFRNIGCGLKRSTFNCVLSIERIENVFPKL